MEKKQNLSAYDVSAIPRITNKKIAVITSEWNYEITSAMKVGCIDTLIKHGFSSEDIIEQSVGGSFELPLMAKIMIKQYNVDAVICIGCIIQGETKHFDFIAQATANGIMQVGLDCEKPVIFGVITANNKQQALDRAGGIYGNKGVEAAITCLKLLAF
ncbi:MAG: 6,7-dimethyl-8-ribityllumazine synthase [Bacteroidales bacterium]|jgi:6,7-dimethyl-8-ribityllumazine synthase|nr:6,7-dimethyl-8-ribityllumazine synthase [Bacteroidales bacterium]